MEFLVQITVSLPAEMPAERLQSLREAELTRGRELSREGAIKSIWRIPGGLRNVGIWEASDATALHALIESLPMYPWIAAKVTALARHPLSEDAQ